MNYFIPLSVMIGLSIGLLFPAAAAAVPINEALYTRCPLAASGGSGSGNGIISASVTPTILQYGGIDVVCPPKRDCDVKFVLAASWNLGAVRKVTFSDGGGVLHTWYFGGLSVGMNGHKSAKTPCGPNSIASGSLKFYGAIEDGSPLLLTIPWSYECSLCPEV